MEITRHNYEEFFVLYIDKELNAADRAEVERFVSENPDLKAELEMFSEAVLPTEEVAFINKSDLYRSEAPSQNNPVTVQNCEEYFVMYADNELTDSENACVEGFVYKNPSQQENFELIQQIKFQPEKHIVFPDKSTLYRSTADHKVVPMFARMRFWKMAAAASVIAFFCVTGWFALNNNESVDATHLATNTKVKQQPAASKNADNSIPSSNDVDPEPATAAIDTRSTSKIDVPAVTPSNKKPDVTKAIRGDELYAQSAVKKSSAPSNISTPASVPQISGGTEKVVEKKVEVIDPVINKNESMALAKNDNTVQSEQVAIGPVELKEGSTFASLANENDEMFESPDKNKKMRGFFRRVSRVFDKATSKEPVENKKSLRIASFAIAL